MVTVMLMSNTSSGGANATDIVMADSTATSASAKEVGSDDKKGTSSGKLTGKEMRQRGSLSSSTVWRYFESFYSRMPAFLTILFITILMAGAEGCNILTSWWLARCYSDDVLGNVYHSY